MKYLVILVLSAFAMTAGGDIAIELNEANEIGESADTSPTMTANMNSYMDLVMIQVGPFILRNGWIPMDLPDFEEAIEHRVLLITYHGLLELWNGELTRLVSVGRHGNAFMTYDRKMLRIQMAAAVRQITFRYDYTAEIMGLGPTGWLEGNTAHIAIACDFIVDFENFFVYMQNFQVVSLGTLTIVMRGNPVIDWLSNLIVNTVTLLFNGPITEFISTRFQVLLQETLDEMNAGRVMAGKSPEQIQEILQNLLALNGFEKPLL